MLKILLPIVILLTAQGAPGDTTTIREQSVQEDSVEKAADWERRLEMLRSVPYLSLSEAAGDRGDTGVVICDPEKSSAGYNLYSSVLSGQAFLLDMKGREVHRWTFSDQGENADNYAVMLPGGDLVAIAGKRELVRVDWNSQVIWRKALEVHHEIWPLADGSFYVLIREQREHRGLRVVFPAVLHLNAAGEEMARWSSADHLDEIRSVLNTRFFLDTILDSMQTGWSPKGHEFDEVRVAMRPGRFHYDYFHMNTVSELPLNALEDSDGRFRRGNLLVCFRNVNQIALLEKDTYRPLWAWGEGELDWPHHPTMLENGHILIFDNGTRRKYSRVIELDPISETIVWEYTAPVREDFFSLEKGSAQRLPNGNTLICESDRGRVFEVTREEEVVWQWMSPVGGERNRHEALYRMMRLPVETVEPLLVPQP